MKRWQDWVNLALGVWLVVSPWLLSFNDNPAATWNSVLIGLAFAALSLMALTENKPWEEWGELILTIWLLISPWALGFNEPGAAMWNTIIVAVAAGIASLTAVNRETANPA